MHRDRWVVRLGPGEESRLRLFCFPYAGGGAAAYRSWQQALPPEIEVCLVQLPGREDRLVEPAFTSFPLLVPTLARELRPYLDRPFAFFGHSMGALIAFELARHLERSVNISPLHLFVSGCGTPECARTASLHLLSDDDFLFAVRQLNGTPDAVFANPELIQLILPQLRADFQLVGTYVYSHGAPLTCPISVFSGAEDALVPRAELDLWSRQTVSTCITQMFPGGHFFVHTAQEAVWNSLGTQLDRYVRAIYASPRW